MSTLRDEALVLGIETSCDETSAAVVRGGFDVLSNVVSSQIALHARYGGVVPEIAARAHLEALQPVLEQALRDAGVNWADLHAIAVADGPGLAGALLIGVTAARTLAWARGLPLTAVDHIAAHATSAALDGAAPPWPCVSLVASGGHTSLYHVRDPLQITLLGQTRDDAAGEAFDKVATILGLGFPGGPHIDRLALTGDPRAVRFPQALMDGISLDFSFSGLKTAVLYHVYGAGRKYGSAAHLTTQQLADVAASFQAAVVAPLTAKTLLAARQTGVTTVAVGGGVCANRALRAALQEACTGASLQLRLTPPEYCTDNAAMIAAQGWRQLRAGQLADLSLEPRSGLLRG